VSSTKGESDGLVADRGRFYCIWDSFRAQHPLLTIIDPVAQTEMVRALIDIYRHEGMYSEG
jgi:putative alpha-1,2-mannosidase